MNAIEEIKKSLYESYKWLYEEAVTDIKEDLAFAKNRRELGRMDWAADWLERANTMYKMAISYKRSMRTYAD